MDPLNIQDTAARVYAGFLVHAAETPAADWHEFYKWINRAAGVIAGHAHAASTMACQLPPEMIAEKVADAVLALLDTHKPGSPEARRKIAGPKGLAPRLVKCLAAMEGVTADRAVLS